MGAAIGLGIDETYVVAAGRALRFGYFDHPPAVWWLSSLAAHLGGDAPVVVRLPFILLFAGSTWLMYRLGARLFGAASGLWAAVAMNLSPVLGLTTAGWVLPDGPMDFCLLAAMNCLLSVLPLSSHPRPLPQGEGEASRGWRGWLGAGLFAGLALFSKYNAVLVLGGVAVFFLTEPTARRWLRRPQPYAAVLLAAAVFSPVLIWNATHHWASFAFQGDRAGASALHPFGPLVVLGGEALFLLPWIWLPLMACFVAAFRRGPREPRGWLLCCAGAPPVVLFALVALWSSQRVLFHWAAPGYLMLFPLLGDAIARRVARGDRAPRAWMLGTAALLLAALGIVAIEFNTPSAARGIAGLHLRTDPNTDALDWRALRDALAADGLQGTPVAALNWRDAGKIDYALGGGAPVLVLSPDRRQYGFNAPPPQFAGQDLIVVAPAYPGRQPPGIPAAEFGSVERLPPVTVAHLGVPALTLDLWSAHDYRPAR